MPEIFRAPRSEAAPEDRVEAASRRALRGIQCHATTAPKLSLMAPPTNAECSPSTIPWGSIGLGPACAAKRPLEHGNPECRTNHPRGVDDARGGTGMRRRSSRHGDCKQGAGVETQADSDREECDFDQDHVGGPREPREREQP